jgi:hypothetical protein
MTFLPSEGLDDISVSAPDATHPTHQHGQTEEKSGAERLNLG